MIYHKKTYAKIEAHFTKSTGCNKAAEAISEKVWVPKQTSLGKRFAGSSENIRPAVV